MLVVVGGTSGGAAGANGLNASLIIAAIAIGVAVPNILARNRVNAAKRRTFEAQIREQHAQGHFIDIAQRVNNHQFSSKLFDLYEKMAIFAAVFVRYRMGTKEFITY